MAHNNAAHAQQRHQEREIKFKAIHHQKQKKKRMVLGIVVGLLVLVSAVSAYSALTPGDWDDFAKCLTSYGAKMYGEDWCQYTNAQKGMFGKSFKYVDYEVKQGLNKRPTWEIDGKRYETVQSFQRLSALTGCAFISL